MPFKTDPVYRKQQANSDTARANGTFTGNLIVGASKFTVAGANGNFSGQGTGSITGDLVLGTSLTLATGANVVVASLGAGSMIGTSAAQKLGFWGMTPVVQPAGANQAALTDSTGGSASTTLAAITAGASYAQADATATKNAIASLARLLNQLRGDLVTAGLIKGAA